MATYRVQYSLHSLVDGFYRQRTTKHIWIEQQDVVADSDELARKAFWKFINKGEGKLGTYRLLDLNGVQITQN